MTASDSNARAIFLIVVAMAAFATVDAFVKLASASQSAGQIVAISSGMAFLVFWVVLLRTGERLLTPAAWNPLLLIRSLGEAVGGTAIVIALGLAPLSSVMALAQAQPLAVVIGAALLLGETVGWRRWLAVGLGLVGVFVILRPGLGAFDPNLLWVLGYIVGLAARDLSSRRLPPDISTPFAVAWSMVPMVALGILLMVFQGGWQPVTPLVWLYYVAMTAGLSLALWTMTAAMRVGEISAVAPFRYSRILFALIIAYVVFGEVPDAMTWLGAALIVGGGIYTLWRERQLAKKL